MSRAATARDRALAFVERGGDPLARARAAALVGAAPSERVVEVLAAGRRADGAILFEGAAQGAMRSTLRALGALDDLRALRNPLAEGACAFLESAQRPDGSWRERDEDSEMEALFLTGTAAGMLAKTPCARSARLAAAAEHLAQRWSPDRVQGGDWRAIAAYAHLFANTLHELSDEVLQWCGRELERGWRSGRFDAARTGRILVWCDAPTLPGARIETDELAASLIAEQDSAGGWPAQPDACDPARIESTLDALAVLDRLAPC